MVQIQRASLSALLAWTVGGAKGAAVASLSPPRGVTTRSQVLTLVHKTRSHPKVHVTHSHTQHAGHTHARTQTQTHVRTCATTSLRLSSPEEAEPWGRASQHGPGGGTPASRTHAPGPFGVETGRQAPALLWRPQHPPVPPVLHPIPGVHTEAPTSTFHVTGSVSRPQ